VHGVAEPRWPARRRIAAMQRQVDQVDDPFRVEADWRAAVQFVFKRGHRIAEHLIHVKSALHTPFVQRY